MVAKIGPNALTQTIRALSEAVGDEHAATIVANAHLSDTNPTTMVDEQEFAALVTTLTEHLSLEQAHTLLHQSGRYTADYLLAHRIPKPFQRVLGLLPRHAAMWLLLVAISQHAWTFAGGGRFSYRLRKATHVTVVSSLSSAASGFYGGTFERLIHTLVDSTASMTTDTTSYVGGTTCTYTFKRA